MNDPSVELKLAVFNELSTAMRHQSQAEYIYTASAVASYGGICLGVAALPSDAPVELISWGVALFVLTLSVAIYRAIAHNCAIYKKIQHARLTVARSLDDQPSSIIPDAWLDEPNPTGVNKAYAILFVTTFGAVAFSVARACGA